MKPVLEMIHSKHEKLPLEHPIREALGIYGRRLFIFSIVVVANLVLLGAAILVSRSPLLSFPILIVIFLTLFIPLFVKRRTRPTEIRDLGGMSREEFVDAIIALQLEDDIEAQVRKFSGVKKRSLSPDAAEFVKGLIASA